MFGSFPEEYLDQEASALINEFPGLLLTGEHFDFGNGYHGSVYLDPHVLIRSPSLMLRFAQILANRASLEIRRADVIAGPWRGGAILANNLAVLLGSSEDPSKTKDRFLVPIDKLGTGLLYEGFSIKKEYQNLLAGKRVWIVDDVCNTGKTLAAAAELIQSQQASVVGVGAILRRSHPNSRQFPFPEVFAYNVPTPPNFLKQDCPMCRENKPIFRF